MERSCKFKHIENNLIKLLEVLLSNENFKKYVYYLSDDPLSQPTVNVNLLETNNIILNLFDDSILDEQRVTLFINPYEGDLRSQPLSDLTFTIDIVVPYSKWLLNGLGQIRVFRIADEIAKDIDQKNVMGIGECEITRFRTYKVNNNYSGMALWIKVNSSTLKGLR
ncbi:MAG: hypothetical protein PWR08_1547 [Thermoanaerobacterium sp.]|jgi:hypothetical protein|nr:hypothetical protein [Thermoanaerobacterium sp.]